MYKIILFVLNVMIVQTLFAKTTFIGGHFDKPKTNTVTVQYYASALNVIEGRSTKQDLELDNKNNFMFEIETETPIQFHISNGEAWIFINKYAAAGDSVWFDFKETGTDMTARCEECLAFTFEWEDKFWSPALAKEVNTSYEKYEAKAFSDYWNKRRKNQLDYFNEFFKNKKPPTTFRQFIEAEINYDYAIRMLQYSWIKKGAEGVLKDLEYLKFLNNILVDNPEALISARYLQFLKILPNEIWMSYLDKDNIKDPIIQYYSKNQTHLRDSIARKYFTGVTYDLALYQILFGRVMSVEKQKGQANYLDEYKKSDSILALYNKSFNNDFYYKRLASKLHDLNSPDKQAPDFILKDLKGNNVHLSDFKGKAVYLDFWETTCGPCRAEIPHANALKEKFKDKDVIFLYVSLDNSAEKLKKFVETQSFNGTHLISPKGFLSDVAQLYEINGIPHYFLIDKKGVIISSDAPRPSLHPEELIEKALH